MIYQSQLTIDFSPKMNDAQKLRDFAVKTAGINPHLLGDIERGTIRPCPMLMRHIEKTGPMIERQPGGAK